MREIRYRAWDKTSNLMRTDITSIEFKSDGSLAQINVTSGADILYPEEEAVLMQYTGLKDKNGVEIYEGDIVASWYYGGHPTEESAVYEVKWLDKNEAEFLEFGASSNYPNLAPAVGLGFVLLRGKLDHKDLKLCYFSERFEVIGNIYENPELLEAEL